MSAEFDLSPTPDFGYEHIGNNRREQVHTAPQPDTARYSPPVEAPAPQPAHYPGSELEPVYVPRHLVPGRDFQWTAEGTLQLKKSVLERFTVEEVAASVRELEAQGPPRQQGATGNQGKFTFEWRDDEYDLDLKAHYKGAPPAFLSSLFGGGQQRANGQPVQAAQAPATQEAIALPSSAAVTAAAGIAAAAPGFLSRSRIRGSEVAKDRASAGQKAWEIVRGFDWRSPRAWRKRWKRAEYMTYLILADVITGGLAEKTPGVDQSTLDKPFPLEGPISIAHGVGKLLSLGKIFG